MELTFSLSELNKKSPYVLESSGMYLRNDNPRFQAMNEAIDRFIEDFQDKLR